MAAALALWSMTDFMPHGFCYQWDPAILWLHVISDSLIALSYYCIPAILLYLVRKRRDLPFNWMALMFGAFILGCGTTHLMEVWTVWEPRYLLSGTIKAITAGLSVTTAAMLIPLMPKLLSIPSTSRLQEINEHLQKEIRDRERIERELRDSEERYRELFDLNPYPLWVYDLDTLRFLAVNRVATRVYGYSEPEFLSKTILDIRPKEDVAAVQQRLTALGKSNDPTPGTWRHLLKDGRTIEVEIKSHPLVFQGHEARIVMAVDITERQRAERRMRGLLESAPDAVIVVNQQGNVVMANSQTEKLFGYTRAELLGQKMEILVPERFRDRHPGYRNSYNQDLRVRPMGAGLELYARHKDGREFPVEISLSPLETDEGILVSSAIRDITERKRAEARFRALLESAPDAMIVANQDGVIELVNAQVERIFGYARAELLGKSTQMLIPQRFRERYPAQRGKFFQDMQKERVSRAIELFGLHKDGHEFPVEISMSPLETENGMVMCSAVRDVSERKRIEEEAKELDRQLRHQNTELLSVNRELESFAYSVSHDLRAPLRSIDGFSVALQEDCADQLNDEGKDYLERIRNATGRMARLIDDLLELSRMTRSELRPETVDLSAMVEDVANQCSVSDPDRQVSFAIEPGLTIEGDRSLLRAMMENLVGNACKFSSKKPDARVEFGAIPENNHLVYFVRDNGAGFDMAYANKLFGVFQRLHDASEFPGTGVGLATVQRIVHRHGGRIWAESKPGEGASFFFTLEGR